MGEALVSQKCASTIDVNGRWVDEDGYQTPECGHASLCAICIQNSSLLSSLLELKARGDEGAGDEAACI